MDVALRKRAVLVIFCIGVSADNAAAAKGPAECYADVDCWSVCTRLDLLSRAIAPALDWLSASGIIRRWWPSVNGS